MKKLLSAALLVLSACSTQDRVDPQEAMLKFFVSGVQAINLYWMDYNQTPPAASSSRLVIASNGEIPDPADIRTVYTIDTMINNTTAGYRFTQYYADNSSQNLYAVFFIGQTQTGQKAFVRGNFLSTPTPPASPITSTDPAHIAEWKAFHRAAFVKGNFSITRGLILALEP